MTSVGPEGRTALYRFFDTADVLLYVGVTYRPEVRFSTHKTQKAWWPEVHRVDLTWYDAREEAEAAEATAIRTEAPKWNVAIPDEDGVYRTGTGRPIWKAGPEHDQLLAQIREAADARDAAEAAVWEMAKEAKQIGVPGHVIASKTGISRATLYRRFGEFAA